MSELTLLVMRILHILLGVFWAFLPPIITGLVFIILRAQVTCSELGEMKTWFFSA